MNVGIGASVEPCHLVIQKASVYNIQSHGGGRWEGLVKHHGASVCFQVDTELEQGRKV